jgi:hypothetical protein
MGAERTGSLGRRMIEPEDIVLVSARGRTFYARVLGAEHLGRFAIAPLDASVRARSARLADLRGHWARRGDPRPADDAAQASFDHLLDP